MKKKTLTILLMIGVLAFGMTGCQNETPPVVSDDGDVVIEKDETEKDIYIVFVVCDLCGYCTGKTRDY